MPAKTPLYYLETACILDLLENKPTEEPALTLWRIFEDAEKERCELVTSVLTMTEVVWALEEKKKQRLSKDTQEILDKLWHPGSSPLRLVDVHELIARDAHSLLRTHVVNGWTKTRGADAIHLITAKRENADEFFYNGEKAMNKWAEILSIKICKPHWSPPMPEKADASAPLYDGSSK